MAYPLRFWERVGASSLLMPKNLRRVTGLGDLHFITFCYYQRRSFLATPGAWNLTVQILGELRDKYGFALVGHVFMPTALHLLVGEAKLVSPAIAMQVFKQRVSRRMRREKHEEAALALISGKEAELRRFWKRRSDQRKGWSIGQAIGRGVVDRTMRREKGS